jgi:hypothetical protein
MKERTPLENAAILQLEEKCSGVARKMFLEAHRINFVSKRAPIGWQQKGEIIALSVDNLSQPPKKPCTPLTTQRNSTRLSPP